VPPLVSVIIPNYNSEEWIEATLRSVQLQTLAAPDLEFIFVDNGSSDGSANLAESILAGGGSAYQIITLGANAGPSRARNIGWQNANAPWIQFLDSDDLLVAQKLEHQLAFAQTAPPAVAVIYSEWQNYALRHEWQPIPPVRDPVLEPDLIRGLLETENFLATGSQLIRKSWLAEVGGFDENCWLIEDVHLLLRLAMQSAEFLRAPAGRGLFYYRKRAKFSLSASRQADFLNGCFRNFRLAEDHWRSSGELTPSRLQFLISGYERLLHNLIEVDPPGFERLLDHLLSIAPEWKPAYDTRIRLLSSLVGYRRAAQFAVNYRRWKKRLSNTALRA
jgi:glycosyltransferase involved in cell wall biosynthesis